MCYNSQAVERDGDKLKGSQRKIKKLKKSFKKYLTNGKVCDIITKLAARAESETVLEN